MKRQHRLATMTMLASTLSLAIPSPALGADATPLPESGTAVRVITPAQPEGPYYPLATPADSDADLSRVGTADVTAQGQTLVIEGSLLHADGSPVSDAVIEIWQTDHQGIYLHPADPSFDERDDGFQGFGVSAVNDAGDWSFTTILPDIYGGRPRHIHAKVKVQGTDVLTTQIYFSGGDISQAGAVSLAGDDRDALVVEVMRTELDGTETLRASHVIVLP